MKRERAFVENRRKNILDAIIENPKIRVEQLAERFPFQPLLSGGICSIWRIIKN